MCAHRLTTTDADVNTNDLPQPHGLLASDMMVARAVLQSLAPTWTLDTHQDVENGAFMIMLTPPGPEDTTPTFVLSQHTDGIHVTAALGDSCDTLHTACSMRRAVWTALSLHNTSNDLTGKKAQVSTKG